jgi:hypothetical protein
VEVIPAIADHVQITATRNKPEVAIDIIVTVTGKAAAVSTTAVHPAGRTRLWGQLPAPLPETAVVAPPEVVADNMEQVLVGLVWTISLQPFRL